ncbi:hypothetical protein GE09DRAFT_646933 [Coniochaeta sp. 2T2.1]|nr:hypothetical protein GE09DRAFT_646933 [Coniochaeta sp. 2T2.1]
MRNDSCPLRAASTLGIRRICYLHRPGSWFVLSSQGSPRLWTLSSFCLLSSFLSIDLRSGRCKRVVVAFRRFILSAFWVRHHDIAGSAQTPTNVRHADQRRCVRHEDTPSQLYHELQQPGASRTTIKGASASLVRGDCFSEPDEPVCHVVLGSHREHTPPPSSKFIVDAFSSLSSFGDMPPNIRREVQQPLHERGLGLAMNVMRVTSHLLSRVFEVLESERTLHQPVSLIEPRNTGLA